MHLHKTNRAARVRRLLECDVVDRFHHARSSQHGILPQRHRGRSRVRIHARDGHVIPLLPQRTGDHANGQALRLQHGPLLDMGFEVRGEHASRHLAARLRPEVVDAAEFITNREAGRVLLRMHKIGSEYACKRT